MSTCIQPTERFREWVREFGTTHLAVELGTDRTTVHRWTHPSRPHTPRPQLARQILALSVQHSGTCGPLDWPDIYGERPTLVLRRCRRGS